MHVLTQESLHSFVYAMVSRAVVVSNGSQFLNNEKKVKQKAHCAAFGCNFPSKGNKWSNIVQLYCR